MSDKLVIKDLHVKAGEKEILKGINLEVNSGEIHAIMGPNGNGKSTLLQTIMGHPNYTVTHGSIMFNDLDVLNMTVEEALTFFENVPSIKRKIQTLYDVGLSYIRLGQPSTELSGGEAQRIKLAAELSKRSTGKTIYILDEPTTGLHFADVHKLTEILHRLTADGNTVIVIEHNLDVIKTADYIIDIGPEGGDKGGTVIASGTPEEVAESPVSYTGKYIKPMLGR